MQTSPLISILMPVYNAGPWLAECLDSIIRQSQQQWELIAVDDFSTDNSLEILITYAKKDSRIHILSNTKKGIIPALQFAFKKSNGQYITRMDADDHMAPDKLEHLSKILVQNGQGHLATGLVKYISTNQLGDGYQRYEKWLNELTLASNNYQDIYKECVIPSPVWMCHRDDLIRSGAFDSDIYPEDYDLCFRFYKNNLKVLGVKKVLHFWRDYPERTSRQSATYADHRYFDLKLPYFLELDYNGGQPLVLWGAGKKGKLLARKMKELKIDFHWVTNNVRKHGLNIYGVKLKSYQVLKTLETAQLIVAVAAPDDQKEIDDYLNQNELKGQIRVVLFC